MYFSKTNDGSTILKILPLTTITYLGFNPSWTFKIHKRKNRWKHLGKGHKYLAAWVCVIYIERYNSEGETASHIFLQWLHNMSRRWQNQWIWFTNFVLNERNTQQKAVQYVQYYLYVLNQYLIKFT